jgi:hypothetical protein
MSGQVSSSSPGNKVDRAGRLSLAWKSAEIAVPCVKLTVIFLEVQDRRQGLQSMQPEQPVPDVERRRVESVSTFEDAIRLSSVVTRTAVVS